MQNIYSYLYGIWYAEPILVVAQQTRSKNTVEVEDQRGIGTSETTHFHLERKKNNLQDGRNHSL